MYAIIETFNDDGSPIHHKELIKPVDEYIEEKSGITIKTTLFSYGVGTLLNFTTETDDKVKEEESCVEE